MCCRFALRQLIPALFGVLTASSAWSQPTLPPEIAQALAKAGAGPRDVAAVGIDCWAVDYGLLRGGRRAAGEGAP